MSTGFESWADASLVPGTEVLFVKLYGVHTAQTLREWRAEIGAVWGAHCRAYVIDYRRCAIAADAGELAGMQADAYGSKPSAVICSPGHWETFAEVSQRLADLDVLRVPFVDEGSALRWARLAALMGLPQEAGEQSPLKAQSSSGAVLLA